MQFESTEQANRVDFHFAIGFLVRWSHCTDFTRLNGQLVVRARFPRLLPKYARYVGDIGRHTSFVVGDIVVLEDADSTISLRMFLYPSFVENPSQFISPTNIHGEKILQ